MNTSARMILLTVLFSPALALAQSQPGATPQYPEWDKLTQAQRDTLIAPLRDRWNANPDDRARMIEHANRWKTLPPEQRARARHGAERWERMTPDQRREARALFHAMREMSADQRKAFLADWRQKTPQQKADWLKAHPVPEWRGMPPPQ